MLTYFSQLIPLHFRDSPLLLVSADANSRQDPTLEFQAGVRLEARLHRPYINPPRRLRWSPPLLVLYSSTARWMPKPRGTAHLISCSSLDSRKALPIHQSALLLDIPDRGQPQTRSGHISKSNSRGGGSSHRVPPHLNLYSLCGNTPKDPTWLTQQVRTHLLHLTAIPERT